MLAVLLIPHVIAAGILHWPSSFVSFHVGSTVFCGLAALVIASASARDRREAKAIEEAYDTGRAESLAAEIDEFEQRIDRS